MGIRFYCPNGHKLNVKEFQAGRRGICPFCGARTQIPTQSTRPSGKAGRRAAGHTAVHDDDDAQASDSSPDILPGEPPSLPGDPGHPLAGAGHPLGPERVGGKMLGPSTAPDTPSVGSVTAPPATLATGPKSAATQPSVHFPSVAAVLAAPTAPAAGPARSPGPSPKAEFSAPRTLDPTRDPRGCPGCPGCPARAIRAGGAARSDRRGPGDDLVHSAAYGRTVRTRAGRIDADLAQRRPRQCRLAGLARRLARLAGGRHGFSQAPWHSTHGSAGNDARDPRACAGGSRLGGAPASLQKQPIDGPQPGDAVGRADSRRRHTGVRVHLCVALNEAPTIPRTSRSLDEPLRR